MAAEQGVDISNVAESGEMCSGPHHTLWFIVLDYMNHTITIGFWTWYHSSAIVTFKTLWSTMQIIWYINMWIFFSLRSWFSIYCLSKSSVAHAFIAAVGGAVLSHASGVGIGQSGEVPPTHLWHSNLYSNSSTSSHLISVSVTHVLYVHVSQPLKNSTGMQEHILCDVHTGCVLVQLMFTQSHRLALELLD